jgi:hypothetical protein
MATDLNEIYKTDIETVMDFMKLSILFDNPKTTTDNLENIVGLQKSILELLPAAQSERMASVYKLLVEVYRQNKKDLLGLKEPTKSNQTDKNLDYFIILFYKSSCSACKKIMPYWNEFKRQSMLQSTNFTPIEYDSDDTANAEIFQRFKIENVPMVVKLRLDRNNNYAEGMVDPISVNNLLNFSVF